MMNPNIKSKWIAALRSGEYKQTKNHLHDSEGFCCLGVLCDLHAKAQGKTLKLSWVESNGGDFQEYDDEFEILPESVQQWAGLASPNPPIGNNDNITDLATLNDGSFIHAPRTFVEIAALIEAEL